VDREEREERWSGLRERREATANAVHHATANNDNAKKDNANNYKFNNDINDNDKSNNGNGNNESNDSNNSNDSRDNTDDKNSNDDTTSNNGNNTDHQLSPVHRVGSPGGGGSRSHLGGVDGRSPGNGSPGSFRGRNFGGRNFNGGSFGGVGSGGSGSGGGGNYNHADSRGSPGLNGGDGGNHNSFGSYGSYGSSSGRRSGGKGTLYGDELEQDIVDAEALAQRAKRRIELIQNGIKQVRKQQEKGLGRLKRLTPKGSRSKRKRGAQKTPWYPVDF
jgi:hypothetical protein